MIAGYIVFGLVGFVGLVLGQMIAEFLYSGFHCEEVL